MTDHFDRLENEDQTKAGRTSMDDTREELAAQARAEMEEMTRQRLMDAGSTENAAEDAGVNSGGAAAAKAAAEAALEKLHLAGGIMPASCASCTMGGNIEAEHAALAEQTRREMEEIRAEFERDRAAQLDENRR